MGRASSLPLFQLPGLQCPRAGGHTTPMSACSSDPFKAPSPLLTGSPVMTLGTRRVPDSVPASRSLTSSHLLSSSCHAGRLVTGLGRPGQGLGTVFSQPQGGTGLVGGTAGTPQAGPARPRGLSMHTPLHLSDTPVQHSLKCHCMFWVISVLFYLYLLLFF